MAREVSYIMLINWDSARQMVSLKTLGFNLDGARLSDIKHQRFDIQDPKKKKKS